MDIEEGDMDFPDMKMIILWRKGFFKITSTLILPLTFTTILHNQLSTFILTDMIKFTLSFHSILIWLFQTAYLAALTVSSLLSTSLLVHRVTTVYTNKSFSIPVVPLLLRFHYMFIHFFTFNVFLAFYYRCILLLPSNLFGSVLFYAMLAWLGKAYMVAFMTMSVEWLGRSLSFPVLNVFTFMIVSRNGSARWEAEGFYGMLCFQIGKACSVGVFIQMVLFALYTTSRVEDINEESSLYRVKSYLQPLIPLTRRLEKRMKGVEKDLKNLMLL